MYTKPKYSIKDLVVWTRWEILGFLILGTVPVVLYHVLGLEWLKIPWTPVALVGTAVAFMIGFQNNAAYGRIWEARQIWGGIVNASRTLGIMIQDMITNEYTEEALKDEEMQEHRRVLLERHFAWLTALRHAMRQPRPWETSQNHVTNREWQDSICTPERHLDLRKELAPLLSREELERVLSKANVPTAILFLQSSHLRKLKERKAIWEFSFLMLPFALVPEFAKLGSEMAESFPLVSAHFAWVSVPMTALVAWVFNTMHRIGTTGENPFEGTVNDVPISTISRGIEIDLRQQFDCGEIPEAFPALRAVQM